MIREISWGYETTRDDSKRNIYETSGAESGWKRPKTVIRGVDLRSIEDTAVIELLLTRPERKVER